MSYVTRFITVSRDALTKGEPPITIAWVEGDTLVERQVNDVEIMGRSRCSMSPTGGGCPRESKGRQVWVATDSPLIVEYPIGGGMYQREMLPGRMDYDLR